MMLIGSADAATLFAMIFFLPPSTYALLPCACLCHAGYHADAADTSSPLLSLHTIAICAYHVTYHEIYEYIPHDCLVGAEWQSHAARCLFAILPPPLDAFAPARRHAARHGPLRC